MFLIKILIIILVYILIFKPELRIFPASVSVTFGIIGSISYFIFHNDWKKRCSQWMGVRPIILCITPFVLVSVGVGLFHTDGDWYFVKYGLSVLFSFFSFFIPAYLLLKVYGEVKFETVVKYLVICNYLYIIIAFAMFVDSNLRDMMLSLQNLEEGFISALDRTEGLRLQAFGRSFFNAGVIEGFFIIIISLCISFGLVDERWRLFYYISLVFFFISGLFLARTTIIGSAIAVFLLITGNKYRNRRVEFGTAIVISLLLLISAKFLLSSYFKVIEDWAFEAFINYSKTGTFETNSSNNTLGMFEILPSNMSTWLFGDGLWMDKSGYGYYMSTDIGWTRLLFFFGILGVLAMLFYYYKSLKLIFYYHLFPFWGRNGKRAFYAVLIYTILLNIKGFSDVFYLSVIFYYSNCSSKNC